MNRLLAISCALGLLLANTVASGPATASARDAAVLEFDVFLEDDRIGTHRVEISQRGDNTIVTTSADFKYTILMIPVYSYTHRAVETWQSDCLLDIDTFTDDNGDEFFVRSEREQDSLLLSTHAGERTLGDCVRTYAYWDPALLQTDKLLNTQNGKYQSATIAHLGKTSLDIGDGKIEADSYRLETEEGVIRLWYDEQGEWLALESRVENGSLIRYLSTSLRPGDKG